MDRTRRWATGEMPEEFRAQFDPRLQRENTGSDRVAATRLGIARLSATVAGLPENTGGDQDRSRQIYDQALIRHVGFLNSVVSLIGGVIEDPDGAVRYKFVAHAEQREAVRYLLGEGVASLEIYAQSSLLRNLEPVGGLRRLDGYPEQLMSLLLSGPKLALLEMQARFEPDAYGVVSYSTDIVQAVFGTLETPSRGQQVLQVAFLDNTENILKLPPSRNAMIASSAGLLGLGNQNQLQIQMATGGGTAFPGWVRQTLPALAKKLEAAASQTNDQAVALHYQSLAARMKEIANLPIVQHMEAPQTLSD